ncbi:MAG: hypothetical protein ACP5VE_04555 [Chthonomonadales bacterium]
MGVVGAALVLAACMMAAGSLARWQMVNERRTACQSNERKLATALLLYSQDYDSCLPQPEWRAQGIWTNWIYALAPYADAALSLGTCPANPAGGARSAMSLAPYPYSYALNNRFYGVFSPGPFPLDNLEIPAQTALIVETGSCSRQPGLREPAYTDTSRGACVYPSPHEGRMNVAAADGHAVSIKIRHYLPNGHNSLYGRMGGSIYNWNGGHPNGRTWEAPLE